MSKVLCVDDNSVLLEVLSDILNALGYEINTASGGQECLDLLKKGDFRPDMILLDIMMAPMDGWTALSKIRGDPELFTIPVLMLTGKYPTMVEVNTYCSMFDGYLMKPFALNTISFEIDNVLERARIREEVIQDARRKGADEPTLNDYRRLSSVSRVIEQFEKIITNGSFNKDSLVNAEKQLETIVKHLEGLGVLIKQM